MIATVDYVALCVLHCSEATSAMVVTTILFCLLRASALSSIRAFPEASHRSQKSDSPPERFPPTHTEIDLCDKVWYANARPARTTAPSGDQSYHFHLR